MRYLNHYTETRSAHLPAKGDAKKARHFLKCKQKASDGSIERSGHSNLQASCNRDTSNCEQL